MLENTYWTHMLLRIKEILKRDDGNISRDISKYITKSYDENNYQTENKEGII